LGARISVFKPNSQLLKLAYYRNYRVDYNQIIHNDKDYPVLFMRVLSPNTPTTNRRWRTAAILKTIKWLHLRVRHGLTDRHKIWHGDLYCRLNVVAALKFWKYKNSRWRTKAIS